MHARKRHPPVNNADRRIHGPTVGAEGTRDGRGAVWREGEGWGTRSLGGQVVQGPAEGAYGRNEQRGKISSLVLVDEFLN